MLKVFIAAIVGGMLLGVGAVGSVSAIDMTGRACQVVGGKCNETIKDERLAGDAPLVKQVLQSIFLLLGIAAVIMIIYGALKFVISRGDSSAVQAAKNTVLYSVVGLIIAILSWGIVEFVATEVLK